MVGYLNSANSLWGYQGALSPSVEGSFYIHGLFKEFTSAPISRPFSLPMPNPWSPQTHHIHTSPDAPVALRVAARASPSPLGPPPHTHSMAKKANEFLQVHICSVFIFFAACADCSFLCLQLNLVSIFHPVFHVIPACPHASLPTTIQTCKPTEGPPCPALHSTANTVCLENDVGCSAINQSSGVVIPRTRTSSLLAHQSLILHIHPNFCTEVCLLL